MVPSPAPCARQNIGERCAPLGTQYRLPVSAAHSTLSHTLGEPHRIVGVFRAAPDLILQQCTLCSEAEAEAEVQIFISTNFSAPACRRQRAAESLPTCDAWPKYNFWTAALPCALM